MNVILKRRGVDLFKYPKVLDIMNNSIAISSALAETSVYKNREKTDVLFTLPRLIFTIYNKTDQPIARLVCFVFIV